MCEWDVESNRIESEGKEGLYGVMIRILLDAFTGVEVMAVGEVLVWGWE